LAVEFLLQEPDQRLIHGNAGLPVRIGNRTEYSVSVSAFSEEVVGGDQVCLCNVDKLTVYPYISYAVEGIRRVVWPIRMKLKRNARNMREASVD
jgi:hypothetical protein